MADDYAEWLTPAEALARVPAGVSERVRGSWLQVRIELGEIRSCAESSRKRDGPSSHVLIHPRYWSDQWSGVSDVWELGDLVLSRRERLTRPTILELAATTIGDFSNVDSFSSGEDTATFLNVRIEPTEALAAFPTRCTAPASEPPAAPKPEGGRPSGKSALAVLHKAFKLRELPRHEVAQMKVEVLAEELKEDYAWAGSI